MHADERGLQRLGLVGHEGPRVSRGGDDIPDGFIRMSVGCEDAEDLIEDIGQALDKVR